MDMLVKLYDLKRDDLRLAALEDKGVTIRRVLAPEMTALAAWIEPRFGSGWSAEASVAVMRQPPCCFIAVKDDAIVGFACHEATAKGFFGPTGVDESFRGLGIGQALLIVTLLDMHAHGYAYAIIGGAGPMDFYRRSVGAIPIEGSVPGIYRGLLPLASPRKMSHS